MWAVAAGVFAGMSWAVFHGCVQQLRVVFDTYAQQVWAVSVGVVNK